MSAGLFIDVSDLYHKLHRKYNQKLSFVDFKEAVNATLCFAYTPQRDGEASGFIGFLRANDFTVRVKRPYTIKVGEREIKRCSFGVELTLDVLREIDALDTIVLATSNPDFIPLVKVLRSMGKEVVIFACGIPYALSKAASDAVEIEADLLEG